MSEKNHQNPAQETLTKLGIEAMETKCSCRICQQLRSLTYLEMKKELYATRIVSKDLAIKDAKLEPVKTSEKEYKEDVF